VKWTVAPDFLPPAFSSNVPTWATDSDSKKFLKFDFKFVELFEFEIESPLHQATGSKKKLGEF
jgi:hypothetical protein